MDWVTDNAWLAWVGLALVLAAIEAATVDFVFMMVAGGALAAAVAAGIGAPFTLQVIVFVVVALLLVVLVRPLIRSRFMDTSDHGIGAPGLVGQVARVITTVTETDGRVKLSGETWSARVPDGGAPCHPGQEVRVVAIHGATAIVEAIPAASEGTAEGPAGGP